MVQKLIELALRNRLIVLLLAGGLFAYGIYSVKQNPIDAIPDLSENQVIVFTEWMGRSPQVMEDQVTYPLVSNLQGIPKIKNIRGSSMFGMSFVYVIFEDNVDIYWARTRVLERLNFAQRLLPQGVTPSLGPDGTGVGHVYWYHLDISLMDVMNKVKANNNDVGGRKFEMADMAYIIRGLGYIKSKEDVENIALTNYNGIPVRVKDIGSVQMGGDLRLGIFDMDGKGEVVGGIVVMRYNENANKVIEAVKAKMKEVEKGLPEGVTFKTSYDRSTLIQEAIDSVKGTLIEEMIVVSLVVLIFLFHWRSAVIILIQLPISVAAGFIFLEMFGISSNIMSLTGIALAIGVVVDDGIVMVENAYRHISEAQIKKTQP